MKKYSNISGFSIIEVMIAIFIFSMWMASIFMVINSSINVYGIIVAPKSQARMEEKDITRPLPPHERARR